jgi:RND family efflux transporter MFP subunit
MAHKSSFVLKLVLVLAVLAAAAAAGTYFLRPVAKVVTVTKGPAINAVSGSVVVQAEGGSRSLTADVGGRIIWCDPLDPNKEAKKGDKIVQLDTRDIDLDIDHYQIDLDAAKKKFAAGSTFKLAYDAAVENLAIAQKKFDRGLVSEVELNQQKRAVANAKLQLDQDNVGKEQEIASLANYLEQKKLTREKMTITAPFDCVVAAVFAHLGDQISANNPIATLIAPTRTVEASISEENFGGIKLGQKASVTFLGGIGGRAENWIYNGTVSKILPTADPVTQRYLVHIDLKDVPPKELIPGKTGEVTITVDERQAKAIVPRRALLGKTLYVVKDGRVERRTVELGFVWLDGAEVKGGVDEGEQVIVDDLDSFRDQEAVRAVQVEFKPSNSK